jgi:radical SAM superfamily enzyme YgiQ (UPF0313 family)
MYTAPQKRFHVRDEQETLDTIRHCGEQLATPVQRVFLGDGDAMALSTRRLMNVLAAIKDHLPKVRRISSYCLPRNLRHKSEPELLELREAGLTLVYIGAESGDDEVLRKVSKGETLNTTRDALDKLGAAGITRSVMLLNGLEPLNQQELFCEMEQLLQALELKRTVFRSDHASNWLVLKGVLGAEKDRLLREVRNAIGRPESASLRPEWQRGL